MRPLSIVVLLLLVSCAEAEEFVAGSRERDAGATAAGGSSFATGEAATTGAATGGGGGAAGRGTGGTDGQVGGRSGSPPDAGGGAGSTGGAPDAGLGGTGGTSGAGGRGGAPDGGATCSAGCSLKVQYQNSTSPPEPMTATVRVRVDIFNTGTKDVALADLTVRYWFIDAGGSGDKATCYYAQDGCTAVAMKFSPVVPGRKGADRYAEIAFSGPGSLAPGAHTGTISIGVQHVSGGPLYDQTDDYSYGANAPSLVDWPTITAYVGGSLSWGVEP